MYAGEKNGYQGRREGNYINVQYIPLLSGNIAIFVCPLEKKIYYSIIDNQ